MKLGRLFLFREVQLMRNTASTLRRLAAGLALLVFAIVAVPAAFAQETTGAIQGTVTDPTGAVVADAVVTATSDKLIKPVTVRTDSHGFYRLSALPPGTYAIAVEGSGMKAKATNLTLNAGDLPNLNLKVAVGAETIIDVTDSIAMVDTTQSKVETTIDSQILSEIPKGRSFQSVIPFAPGARQEPLQSATGSVLNGNRTQGYQIDGASDGENVYMMEGVNVTGIVGGGVGYQVPFEFVQSVQVKSSSFEAEFGGAIGGVVNALQQNGSNNWHGSIFSYYRSSALNANDQCNWSTTCGLLKTGSASSTTRTDATAYYFIAKQDHYRIVEPGFTIGGPILKDKVRLYSSYVPQFYRLRRDVNFTGTNPGPRQFYQNQDIHYGFSRVDYTPFSKLTTFASWEYLYSRIVGNSLPNPDSLVAGQVNTTAGNDPTTYRADSGQVSPGAIYLFGANYTVNSKFLVSGRYSYLYNNTSDRGKPTGVRYYFDSGSVDNTGTVPTKGLDGSSVPSAYQQKTGYANIAANTQQQFNVLQRKSAAVDLSYVQTGWAGTHNFKGGWAWTSVANNLNSGYKTALVYQEFGIDYTPQTSATACDAVIAQNVATYGSSAAGHCRGNYGYFYVYDYSTGGKAAGNNSGFYIQDGWTVAHTGLTINAGVRLEKEYLPPYSAGASSVNFDLTQKVAPRIGAAYDVFHNGKLKVYGSYGKFFDVIKYSLPRGSFGGEYWHNCVYALDNPNYNAFVPGNNADGHACPTSGSAIGVASGYRFIENLDLRKNVINPTDPGVDPNMKPMAQHEFVVGSEWAITPNTTFTARYARKRLERTVEDIGVTDNLGFYIGNPGTTFGDLLHRALPGSGITSPICPSCPAQPGAIRNYDGIDLRLTKTTGKYFFSAFYSFSKLRGNYPGLTSTFNTDGGGGRQSPNNNRSFDQPQMQFDAHGNVMNGPLPTDRPNTFGGYGSYGQKWLLGETRLGLQQVIYQGSPVSTSWPVISTSAVQQVEGLGNWVPITRGSGGTITAGAVQTGRRTPAYLQTDANLTHYVHVSQDHENRKFGIEMNVYNLFGQHAVTAYNQVPLTAATYPSVSTSTNPTGINFNSLLTGWDYVGVSNNGSGPSNQGNKIVSSSYGLPNLFQSARQIRIKVAYTF
ncbi:TonB-dependent receptor [Terriglobus albidus]|uniref:TonB-dependent receptor n=1 Tax=Terriglobus albidus TaxID=1592106 RepID=A0A5B9EDL8_9BACT|nr:carboxypeptidase regulatory-like domain-containing protein [Terriglobus albidus]QEE30112.1 TonB-dependent receptor [Terriglobus albidus]